MEEEPKQPEQPNKPKINDGPNEFVMVCGYCANHDNKGCRMEINFIDKKMYYLCTECKKVNELDFSLIKPAPYPRPIMSRY